MIENNEHMHPFVGAATRFSTPIDPNSFDPKTWGDIGVIEDFSNTLVDNSRDFVADGIAVDDPIFVISAAPPLELATTVFLILGPHAIDINWIADKDYFHVVYKVGEKAQHTFRSLVDIVSARAIAAFTVHWSQCWVNGRFRDFRPDEKGDVYIIDPEEERKLLGKNRINDQLIVRPTAAEMEAAVGREPGP